MNDLPSSLQIRDVVKDTTQHVVVELSNATIGYNNMPVTAVQRILGLDVHAPVNTLDEKTIIKAVKLLNNQVGYVKFAVMEIRNVIYNPK